MGQASLREGTGLRERIGHRVTSVSLGNKGRWPFSTGADIPPPLSAWWMPAERQARHPPVIGALP